MSVFEEMLSRYEIRTKDDLVNARHEVMQQIALAGLYRGGFFNNAAFYGGTCLRIFYGVQRFSEDMDFSLLNPDKTFRLENYFDSVIKEFDALGKKVEIQKKEKKFSTNVESAFLKDNTVVYNVRFRTEKQIKIKIEVDVNPPPGFVTEYKLLLHPFSFMCRCYSLPDLFAGKMHALLFRSWKNRVKGRDWYDFEWFVRNNISLNFSHLRQRTNQLSKTNREFSQEMFIEMLKEKIRQTKISRVKDDIRPFVKNSGDLEFWSTNYFLKLTDMIKLK